MNYTRESYTFRTKSFVSSTFILLLFISNNVDAVENIEFDSSFLQASPESTIDLSQFSTGASATPGIYRTLIFLNEDLIANEDITFRDFPGKGVRACIPSSILKKIPFNSVMLPDSASSLIHEESECNDLLTALPEASVSFDSNTLRLDISIPQIYLTGKPQDYVDPSLWDKGISALMLGYTTNTYISRSAGNEYKSFYGGVNAGLNLGSWYLRHNGNYNWQQHDRKSYQAINTYLQHDIVSLRSRLLLGQSNTSGVIFDTLPVTGMQIASDERMLPGSLRGYAPEIRGIARTNARVSIMQRGQVIYETSVPPGEFLIKDLSPTGYGGDLDVIVQEADGAKTEFRVPYAALAQLLRPGSSDYSVAIGKLRSEYLVDSPMLYQGVWQYGITNRLTGYAGLQLSQHYSSALGGAAVGTPIGAFAFDITQARTELGDMQNNKNEVINNSLTGQSYRVSYSKLIQETNSNISLAAYRFSTSGFMDFMTAAQSRDALKRSESPDTIYRAKNRISLTAGQAFSEGWGNFFISSALQTYWNRAGNEKQLQFGYNNRTGSVSWGVTASRSYASLGRSQTSYLLSMSLPLGNQNSQHTPQLRTELSRDSAGNWGEQLSLAGSAGNDSQLSYNMTARYATAEQGATGSLNGQYRTNKTNLSGSASAGNTYQSGSFGMNGTLVVHEGGVTLSSYNADTYALVEARGAQGAAVSSYPGVNVDGNGYALVPYLNPYEMNEIVLDPKGTSDAIELENTSSKIAPHYGAIVKVNYKTRRGLPLLINGRWNGRPLPFGSEVLDQKGNVVGSVGQAGQAYALVEEERGKLTVRLNASESCLIAYTRAPEPKDSKPSLQSFSATCSR